MSKFLLTTVCAFGLLLSFASAQEAEEELKAWKEGLVKREINRNVPSGKTWTVWWLAGAYADCSPMEPEVRTTKKPEHGTVEMVSDVKISNFGKESGIAQCNGKKIRGLNVNYKSSGGYTGSDEFDLLVMWPPVGATGSSHGRDWEMHFNPHSPDDALILATRAAIQI
jgi:hypothetical protein